MTLEFIILSFFILFIRIQFVNLYSNDDWVYSWYIKKNNKKIDYTMNNSILRGIHSKPVLHSYLISFFPEKNWKIIGLYLNFIFDFFTLAVVFFLAKKILHTYIINHHYYEILLLIFFSSPNLNPSIGRMQTTSPRTFGLLIFSVFILSCYSLESNEIFFFILLVLINIIAIMSSLFASQAIFFFSIIFSFISKDYLIIFSVLLSYVLPFIFNIKAKENILYSFHQKIWYFKSMHQNTSAYAINIFAGLMSFLDIRSILNFDKNYFIKIFHEVFKNNSCLVFVIYNLPFVIFIIFFYNYENKEFFLKNNDFNFLLNVTIAMVICFLFTSLKLFKFLGQPQRYMEYSLPFYSILISWFFIHLNRIDILYFIILFNIILSLMIFFIFIYKKKNQVDLQKTKEFKSIVGWLNKNAINKNILINPVKLSYLFSYQQLYKTLDNNIKFYFRNILRKHEYGFQYYHEDCSCDFGSEFEGFIQKDAKYLKKKYNINYILLDKNYLNFLSSKSVMKNFNIAKKKILFTSKNFIIYKT